MVMISKKGSKFVVKSESTGRNLSKPVSKKEAVKRLGEVEYFKAHPEKSGKVEKREKKGK